MLTMSASSTANTAEPPVMALEQTRQVDKALERFVDRADMPTNLREAVRYSLLNGGKRLRPVLTLLSCQAVGGDSDNAMPAAMAVELIHAFSLVHDDLPAMDDDDLRRGRPTLHIAKGEAMAILAGDMMMGLAFTALVDSDASIDAALSGRLVAELAAGNNAMIAGQVDDTLGEFDADLSDKQRLERIHTNKTGALIRAACRMGALVGLQNAPAGEASRSLDLITIYAESIGLMFQIVDDLIDVEQTAEHTGKNTGKDLDAGKLTYPGVLGVEASRVTVDTLHRQAIDALAPLGAAASPLRDLCDFLAVRTK
jgi:geranylgeranyl diphosphate synthase, type II